MPYRAKYLQAIIDDQTSPSNPAQHVSNLLPAFISHTGVAPEYVGRIVRLLDSSQLGIVRAPERLLKVRFILIGLHMIRPHTIKSSKHTYLVEI